MDQLRFTAVHEDGQHLVLSSSDGTEVLLPIDERLRAALRPRGPAADAPATALRPRDVQAMIRAGQSAAEVAELTGWPADRVARFEGPIVAEREHVASLARAAHVRGRAPEGGIPTLEARVRERLTARGVDADNIGWDATRPEGGRWTVIVSFVAGQRQRSAGWTFDPVDRTVDALDDEARWLSEDEQALPGSAAGRELLGGAGASEEVDLMTSMRERSRSRGRRKKPSTSRTDPAGLPDLEDAPDQVLPLDDLPYDPETMGLPPAAHGEPAPEPATADAPDSAKDDAAGPAKDDAAGAAPQPAKPTGKSARSRRAARAAAAAAAATASTPTAGAEAPATPETPASDDVDPADGTTSYDVELDFDEDDFEVDPRPQEATLADLFGPGDDDAIEDEFDEDDADDLDEDDSDEPDEPDEPDEDELAHDDPDFDGPTGDVAAGDVAAGDVAAGDSLENAAGEVDARKSVSAVVEDADAEDTEDGPTTPATAGPAGPATPAENDTTSGSDSGADPAAAPEPRPEEPKRRKDGRPGVPSWDDIMFGAKDRGR